MRQKRKQQLPPRPGWAIYLRTSNQETQNPENSQRRQRHVIHRALLEKSPNPIFSEYIDNLSGRYAGNRPGYQQMLSDARAGHFSHVAVENAERFGRNDTEALVAIDELHALGVAVRFADYPDLDPVDPDDRIMVSLLFSMAQRESMKLGQRVRGGLHAKLRSGGFSGPAPDGYKNCEVKTEAANAVLNGKYTRWIEQDPERIHIWREAWDLLLADRHTLADICEELHKRGYHYRSGRPFVHINKNGKRTANRSTLSHIFHNWFYAGWVVSEKAEIPPKTVQGHWIPIVTTEEFERGIQILNHRNRYRVVRRKHDYLLKGLIYIQLSGKTRLTKLTGSKPNTHRSGGGTAYYCIPSSSINILCRKVDQQISSVLRSIRIDPNMIPILHNHYSEDLARKLGHLRPDERKRLEQSLEEIDVEEQRAATLYVKGTISEHIWNNLWTNWQDRRRFIHQSLEALKSSRTIHISNLDDAVTLFGKASILYEKLDQSDQKELLRQIIRRVVVDSEGIIVKVDLHPPFSYLCHLLNELQNGETIAVDKKTKTSKQAGQGSDYVQLC
ncbi:MAG: recombinase family protein [Anaerolineaceae bacterium]|nr:recombinase family protein [Anaerolineaceae bacterium]